MTEIADDSRVDKWADETKGEYYKRIRGVVEEKRKWAELCVVIECDRMAEIRGLCSACYSRVNMRMNGRGISMKKVTNYRLWMEASLSHKDYLQLEPRDAKKKMRWAEEDERRE